LRVYSIPMRTRFRGVTRRDGVLIHGSAGWGEFSPFPEYGPRECARWLAAALEAAHTGWPAPLRDRIPVNVTVPAVDPERAHAIVRASGCRTAKVKVAERGQSDADDLARVEAVRDALGARGKVRIDVNGAWDVHHAGRMIRTLDRFDLEYVEQPCARLEELAELRRKVDVPIAADESIRRAEDPLKVRAAEAADVAVLKVQPLGGVRPALRIAEACGLPVVVSSAVETSVGLAAGLALAAALPELPFACGLATLSLLEGDVVADPLLPENGEIPVRRPEPDEAALGRFEIGRFAGGEVGEVSDGEVGEVGDGAFADGPVVDGHGADGRVVSWRRRVAAAQALMDRPLSIDAVTGRETDQVTGSAAGEAR
jgi:o-succinylbenzoate synthase